MFPYISLVGQNIIFFSEHAKKTGHRSLWNEVKFSDRDSHWYTRRVKEATQLESDSFTRKKNHVKFGLILTHGFVAQLVVAYASIWEIQFNLVEAFFFHASFLQCL